MSDKNKPILINSDKNGDNDQETDFTVLIFDFDKREFTTFPNGVFQDFNSKQYFLSYYQETFDKFKQLNTQEKQNIINGINCNVQSIENTNEWNVKDLLIQCRNTNWISIVQNTKLIANQSHLVQNDKLIITSQEENLNQPPKKKRRISENAAKK